ncbi:hypothetical protein ACFWIB_15365 [Streptomyces sp. NPDC127051]|uniref:hypothetical protein n=1 Tax=Streptomyces sp. NPDC127051 TaxID=3347119 RepID=UPI0036464FC3
MTEPRGPIDWANHYAAQREQRPSCLHPTGYLTECPCPPFCPCCTTITAPVRHTAATITEADLDQLYGELGLIRHLHANVRQTCTDALNRAERAERVAQSAARDTAKALTDYLAAEQRAEKAEREAARWQAGHERAEALLHRGRQRLGELEAAIERVRAWAVHLHKIGNSHTAQDGLELLALITGTPWHDLIDDQGRLIDDSFNPTAREQVTTLLTHGRALTQPEETP